MRNPRLLLPATVVAALLVVAGCGGGGGGGGEQGGGGGGGGGGSEGNNLVVAYDQEPPSLNPFTSDALATNDMAQAVLDKPYEIQPDLTYAPQLAEGEPRVVSEDPFTIEYTLKEGLTWSDGEPLTSADARFTYEQIMNPDNQIITREGFDKITEFETPDERTVRMVFSEPYALWQTLLGGSNGFILPEHVYAEEDFNTAMNEEIVGSGPFVFDEFRRGESLRVTRNENYWGEAPALDSVTYRFIPDTNSNIAALQAGEVSLIRPAPDVGLFERLEGIEGTTTDSANGTQWEHIAFNTEVIDNPQLRQAIAYGINRQQIIDELLQGQEVPALQSVVVPEQDQFYTPSWERYTYDPDRARQLVEEATAAGADPTITFSTTSGNALRETLQELVQQQLGDVGITVEIANQSAEQFFGETTLNGDFEMGLWAWIATPEPDLVPLFSSGGIPPEGQNYYRYENEEVSSLLEEYQRTVDEGQQGELVQQATDLMAEDVPLIPIYQRPEVLTFSDGLQGPDANPTLAGAFWNIEEWELAQ
ncbi:ABC transporter substrate-binding protein [Rubrobacter marinus]|nr:peptide ABC transporter substrate-binding protein [Rubrobacter marinus]